MTVKEEEELEQTLKSAQSGEENGCSKEQLNNFSQVAEQRSAVEMGLTAKSQAGVKEEDEHSEEWLNIFSTEAENTATEEVAEVEAKGEETDSICFANLWDQIEALEERVKVQGGHIQQMKLEIDEGMGDHDDLPNGQNFLQMRRLQQKNQPLEQLDQVIMEIMELMLKSADTTSEEQLDRRRAIAAAQRKQQQQQQNGAHGKLQRLVWDPGGFQQLQGKLMSRSS
jgi:hypothetical protein